MNVVLCMLWCYVTCCYVTYAMHFVMQVVTCVVQLPNIRYGVKCLYSCKVLDLFFRIKKLHNLLIGD